LRLNNFKYWTITNVKDTQSWVTSSGVQWKRREDAWWLNKSRSRQK
jgi:hypothetical protein